MALPNKRKRGIRLLKHEGCTYYWKVKNDYAKAELEVLIGLESKPSQRFYVRVGFVDSVLYGPWLAAAQEQGRDMSSINELQAVSPKFIVSAIDVARASGWPEKSPLKLYYKQGNFVTEG